MQTANFQQHKMLQLFHYNREQKRKMQLNHLRAYQVSYKTPRNTFEPQQNRITYRQPVEKERQSNLAYLEPQQIIRQKQRQKIELLRRRSISERRCLKRKSENENDTKRRKIEQKTDVSEQQQQQHNTNDLELKNFTSDIIAKFEQLIIESENVNQENEIPLPLNCVDLNDCLTVSNLN